MMFSWMPFYKEMAHKLLRFRNDRQPLINWIYNNLNKEYIKHLKDNEAGKRISDIDPFTVYAIFNRGTYDYKRKEICTQFKDYLGIEASVPQDFDGIPMMSSTRSNFIGFEGKRKDGDVERLWDVFAAAVNDEDIQSKYDALNGQFLIKMNPTIGLFWIRPDKYIPLDDSSRSFLKTIGINIKYQFLPYENYLEVIKQLNEKINTKSLGFSDYVGFSYAAYQFSNSAKKKNNKRDGLIESISADTDKHYWLLVADPEKWSFKKMNLDSEVDYGLLNEDGEIKSGYDYKNVKVGDIVLGYEKYPNKQIVCVLEISKETDGKSLYFKKISNLSVPIDLSVLKTTIGLEKMKFLHNTRAIFSNLTTDEYNIIMKLIGSDNPRSEQDNSDDYDKAKFLDDVYVSEDDYDRLKRILIRKKNLILQGAPGVGKTFAAKRLAYSIMGKIDKTRVIQVQFHQNYSYEDFVMGYKPNDGGGFILKDGVFYDFCKKAKNDKGNEYFFIIDEINRGNLSKIFGELLMLIEKEYRNSPIRMSYKDEEFSVPDNLYLIGLMNTADRSLAMIDYALRRRFSFFEMKPALESPVFIKNEINSKNDSKLIELVEAIKKLNAEIKEDASLGSGFCIGHSYLCNLGNDYNLDDIVEFDIIPMLREYWFDNDEKFNNEVQKLRVVLK